MKIKEVRESKQLLLRQVADYLEIDFTVVSRVENGQRGLSRRHVVKLAEFFNLPEEDLLSLWLCDRVLRTVGDDPVAVMGIKAALSKIDN
ncbi:MAG: helix-turn-helix transcriptional regulator [Bacteroidales bacterium]